MLNKPVSILPCWFFTLLSLLSFATWAGIVPAPGWLVVLGLYLGFMNALFALAMAIRWIADETSRAACMRDVLHPETRLAEAIRFMNDKQLLVLSYALNIETDDQESDDDPDLIRLHTGEDVSASAIARIARNRVGDELAPERSYEVDRKTIRHAHDALARADIVEPGQGPKPPRIKNPAAFDQILQSVRR